NIINFDEAKARQLKKRASHVQDTAKKKLMCKNSHHKWRIYTAQRFDVKEGKLLTIYKCEHCGIDKTEMH
ncbi:MAG: hypothetical protein KAG18_04505, partial [Sinobacterium sp.]|nr:hypothetical protein [Sinobacterium sp.]